MIVELCVHGEAKPHWTPAPRSEAYATGVSTQHCPGGRVLEGAIIIERDTDGWKLPLDIGVFGPDGAPVNIQELFDALASAQEHQR